MIAKIRDSILHEWLNFIGVMLGGKSTVKSDCIEAPASHRYIFMLSHVIIIMIFFIVPLSSEDTNSCAKQLCVRVCPLRTPRTGGRKGDPDAKKGKGLCQRWTYISNVGISRFSAAVNTNFCQNAETSVLCGILLLFFGRCIKSPHPVLPLALQDQWVPSCRS